MPISAPKPNSKPSVKRVEALTKTAAESTSAVKRSAAARSPSVTIASARPEPCAAMKRDRLVERVDDLHRQDQVEVLGVPVRLGRGRRAGQRRRGVRGQPRSSTPAARQLRGDRGQEARRRRRACTSRFSIALQTPGRCILAFRQMRSAMREVGGAVDVERGRCRSKCWITGMREPSVIARISSSPPRGMMTSMQLVLARAAPRTACAVGGADERDRVARAVRRRRRSREHVGDRGVGARRPRSRRAARRRCPT